MTDGWSSANIYNFRSEWTSRWPPNGLFWFSNISSLKLLSTFSPNLTGMMFSWSSTKIPLFVPTDKQDGHKQLFFILIGGFSKIFSSDTTVPNLTKLDRNDVWMVHPPPLHKNTPLRSCWKKTHERKSWFYFLIGRFLKIFFSQTTWPN